MSAVGGADSHLADAVCFIRLANNPDLPLPSRQTAGSAGYDVSSAEEEFVLAPGERRAVSTGLKMELPPHLECQVRPRSGLALRHGLTLPNTPAEATESDRTFSEAMETWSRENQPTPPDVIEPKARKRRAEQRRKAKAAQESASKQEAEDGTDEEAGEGESESTQTT